MGRFPPPLSWPIDSTMTICDHTQPSNPTTCFSFFFFLHNYVRVLYSMYIHTMGGGGGGEGIVLVIRTPEARVTSDGGSKTNNYYYWAGRNNNR